MVESLRSIKARLSLNKNKLDAYRSLARVERSRKGPLGSHAFELVAGVSQPQGKSVGVSKDFKSRVTDDPAERRKLLQAMLEEKLRLEIKIEELHEKEAFMGDMLEGTIDMQD